MNRSKSLACERLALTASGQVRYTLKTPYRDGTTHIVLEPLDLMARLAALVPKPRMHLTRYHGVLAPHSQHRGGGDVGALGPGRAAAAGIWTLTLAKVSTPRHVAMSWARRLKRVFDVEIESCTRCGGGAEDHRQHRGAAAHCEDPVAPGAHGAGAVPERAIRN